jgi:hypothetical protein
VQPGRKEGFRKHNIVEVEGACLISCRACLWRRTLSAAAAAMALVSTVGATKMLIGLEGAHSSGVSIFGGFEHLHALLGRDAIRWAPAEIELRKRR